MNASLRNLDLSNLLESLKLDNKKIILIALICIIFLYLDINLIFKAQFNA